MSDCGQSGKQTAENIFDLSIDGFAVRCFLPPDSGIDKIVYIHAAMPDEAGKVWQHLSCKCVLVYIGGIDWNRDMSPWYHTRVFAHGEDFPGGADAYLSVLCGRLIPEVERELFGDVIGKERYLAGYSLGGLFALYALYHTALFDGVGTISGSLWYDGLLAYIEEHTVCRLPKKIYFSLGDKEDRGNPKMRTVAEQTGRIARMFSGMGVRTVFERNPGNHFTDVPNRIAKGIDWLVGETDG